MPEIFVKKGIPNIHKLGLTWRFRLEEKTRVANVESTQLSNATNKTNGFSPRILNDNEAVKYLKKFGFQQQDGNLWLPPKRGGIQVPEPMTLDETRVFVRAHGSFNGQRLRVKTGRDAPCEDIRQLLVFDCGEQHHLLHSQRFRSMWLRILLEVKKQKLMSAPQKNLTATIHFRQRRRYSLRRMVAPIWYHLPPPRLFQPNTSGGMAAVTTALANDDDNLASMMLTTTSIGYRLRQAYVPLVL
ncbi:expressed unknown protein [Seminavis robusta]|uniref:Uncharacterized protein n=1 Tax=Seminavis robusta TaxID=568900 RepID=A0A9N8DXM1_9STRA|nr:expressed unknown protein [Seminavis robusta]|eukprot:Sro425_g140230.1 n/a (243) ;mRNA; f:55517-56245